MKNALYLYFLLLFLLSACATEEVERGKSLLNIYLIDAPGDYGQLWVELLGVEVQVIGTGGMDNADPKFLAYIPADKQVNLSALISGNQLMIGRGEFMVGTLISLTLKLGTNNYLIMDDQKIPLIFESEESASPTVNVSFDLEPGISHDYYLDFNIHRSLRTSDNGLNPVILNPKISGFSKANTGQIGGTVLPQGLGAIIYAIHDLDTVTTGVDTEGNRGFVLQGLEGSYQVIIQPFRDDYKPDTLPLVVVQSGQMTNLGNITLETN